jgi:hypothetical protein
MNVKFKYYNCNLEMNPRKDLENITVRPRSLFNWHRHGLPVTRQLADKFLGKVDKYDIQLAV